MIASLTLELRIEHAQSLKDKRQVVRSMKDRLRASFNVSVAELDPSNIWNQATIGVVAISHSRDYLDGLMKNVERAALRIEARRAYSHEPRRGRAVERRTGAARGRAREDQGRRGPSRGHQGGEVTEPRTRSGT